MRFLKRYLVVAAVPFLASPAALAVDIDTTTEGTQKAAVGGDSTEPEFVALAFAVRRETQRMVRIHPTTGEKEERVKYEPSSSSHGAMIEFVRSFGDVNFEVLGVYEVDDQIEVLFTEDFVKAGQVSGEKRQYAMDVIRESEIPFFAYVLLDIKMSTADPKSGQHAVAVGVSARMLDLKTRFARVVARVGPVEYRGFGSTPHEAETDALARAYGSTASKMSGQLMPRKVR